MSRSILDLVPGLQEKCRLLIQECAAVGIPVIITSTMRSIEEQAALYAQGRNPLDIVNGLRVKAGLWLIGEVDNKKTVTDTMKSMHLPIVDVKTREVIAKSRAFDIAIVKDRKQVWDLKVDVNENDLPDWEEVGAMGERIGLEWGGRWEKPDRPHFQEKRGG
jgi:peptidoglycan LD-endopeptidase CwlK